LEEKNTHVNFPCLDVNKSSITDEKNEKTNRTKCPSKYAMGYELERKYGVFKYIKEVFQDYHSLECSS
jgi:hypothetical protein